METETQTIIYTIFERPADFPDLFVVRRFYADAEGVTSDLEPFCLTKRLEIARASLPLGLYNLGRQPGDDAAILESWI